MCQEARAEVNRLCKALKGTDGYPAILCNLQIDVVSFGAGSHEGVIDLFLLTAQPTLLEAIRHVYIYQFLDREELPDLGKLPNI